MPPRKHPCVLEDGMPMLASASPGHVATTVLGRWELGTPSPPGAEGWGAAVEEMLGWQMPTDTCYRETLNTQVTTMPPISLDDPKKGFFFPPVRYCLAITDAKYRQCFIFPSVNIFCWYVHLFLLYKVLSIRIIIFTKVIWKYISF